MAEVPPAVQGTVAEGSTDGRPVGGESPPQPLPTWALLVVFALIGLNLRTMLGSVPAVIDDIGDDLGLTGFELSLLIAIPVLCMGLLAPPAQRVAHRIGLEWTVAVSLGLLTLGDFLRLWGENEVVLYMTALLIGAGMGGASTVMPGLIGHHLRRSPGLGTGMYSMSMAAGSALAAWTTVSLATALGGWTAALAAWAIPAGLTALGWVLLLPRLLGPERSADEPLPEMHRLPWRSRLAILLAIYFAVQTFVGMSAMTWIAAAYQEWGRSGHQASTLLAVFAAVQVLAMLVLPWLTDRTTDRRALLALSVGCSALGLLMVVVSPVTLAWPAMLLFGFGVGGGFSIGVVLLVDYTDSKAAAASLSAMVFLVSYTIAAFGPVFVGVLHDLTGGFAVGYSVLLVLTVANLFVIVPLRPGILIEGSHRPRRREQA